MPEAKYCTAECQFFRCNQRTLTIRGNLAWCNFAQDKCEGYRCNYALCIRGRILVSGHCGLTVKRETADMGTPEETLTKTVKLKPKVMRKIGEKDLF